MSASIEMFVGESKLFNIAVTQDGAPVDITNWTFRFVGSSSLSVAQTPKTFVVGNVGFSIVNGPAGTATLTIEDGETTALGIPTDAIFFFSLKGTEPGGASHILATGTLKLKVSADGMAA